MTVEILGGEGSDVAQLQQNVHEALALLGVTADVTHITDSDDIREYGISETPALAVNGDVLFEGKIASPAEIKMWMSAWGWGR